MVAAIGRMLGMGARQAAKKSLMSTASMERGLMMDDAGKDSAMQEAENLLKRLNPAQRDMLRQFGIESAKDAIRYNDTQSEEISKYGVKPVDVTRNTYNEKYGITNEKTDDSSDKISTKSRIYGSLDVSKANFYDKSKTSSVEDTKQAINDTPETRFEEGLANGLKSLDQDLGHIVNDIEKNGEISTKDLNSLEKDEEKLAKDLGQNGEDDGSGISIEHESSLSKAKNVVKTVKEYDRLVDGDAKNLDDLNLVTDFQSNTTFNSPGDQRLSRNHAHQNARRAASAGGLFSKTSRGGVYHATAGGPRSEPNLKLGSYDPSRGQVSNGWFHKTFDPVRNFYNKHEKAFDRAGDYASNLNNQLRQNIQQHDPTSVFMELMEKAAKDSGVDMPEEGSLQNNQTNNNNNNSDYFLKKKMGFGKEASEYKTLAKGGGKRALAENIVSKKGGKLQNLEHEANLKTLESKSINSDSNIWKNYKESTNKVSDFLKKTNEEADKYFINDINNALKQVNFGDPLMKFLEEMAPKSGVEIPEEGGPQNNASNNNGRSIVDGVLSSKGEKKKPASASRSEKSSLGNHSNSETAMVEYHHRKTAVVEHHSETSHTHAIDIESSKGDQPKLSRRDAGFFEAANDQSYSPHLREGDVLLHKQAPNTPETIKTEKALKIEEGKALKIEKENQKLSEEHAEETIDKLEVISEIGEALSNSTRNKSESDARQIEDIQKQQKENEKLPGENTIDKLEVVRDVSEVLNSSSDKSESDVKQKEDIEKQQKENEKLPGENTEETIDKLEIVKDVNEVLNSGSDKSESDAKQKEDTEKQQNKANLKEERQELRLIQDNEAIINQDGGTSASSKEIMVEAEILVEQIQRNGANLELSRGAEVRQEEIVAKAKILEEQILNKEGAFQQSEREKAIQKAKMEVVEGQLPKNEELVRQESTEEKHNKIESVNIDVKNTKILLQENEQIIGQEQIIRREKANINEQMQEMDTFDEMKAILQQWENQQQLTWITRDQSASQEVFQTGQVEERDAERVKAEVRGDRDAQDQGEMRVNKQIISQEVSQTGQVDKRDAEKVKAEVREGGEVLGVQKRNDLEDIQVQINFSEENFLFEKKASDLNAIRLQTDNRIVAKTTEAMLPPDNELSQRHSPTDPIANKIGRVENHALNSEEVDSLSELNTSYYSHIEDRTNLENKNKVDRDPERASVKPGEQEPVSRVGDRIGEQVEPKNGEEESKILRAEVADGGEQQPSRRVETENLTSRADAMSEPSQPSASVVAEAITETDQKPTTENTSETIEQVIKSEEKVLFENKENKLNKQEENQMSQQENVQFGKEINEKIEIPKNLEKDEKLEVESTESSRSISDTEKAKLEFVNSFAIERLPADLHETAKKLAEDIYKDAQQRNMDIRQVQEQIQEQLNDDNLRGNFIKGLYQQKAMMEASRN